MISSRSCLCAFAFLLSLAAAPTQAVAWGDTGHEIVASVAARILKQESPATLSKIEDALEDDTDEIIPKHDIASQARWADGFRESSDAARALSAEWHYVDMDFDATDLADAMKKACFNHPKLMPTELASQAPSPACIADKIKQFTAELGNSALSGEERLLALKFLLHFVGDIHQPLHGITRHDPVTARSDRGGNCVGLRKTAGATTTTRLHSFWDTAIVRKALPAQMDKAVDELMTLVTPANAEAWSKGGPDDWARESYGLAKTKVYAGIIDQTPLQADFVFTSFGVPDNKCGPSKVYLIPDTYETAAIPVVKEQLAKAGFRLAQLLRANMK